MRILPHVSLKDALTAFAYALLVITIVPETFKYNTFNWALLPLWMVLVGYSCSMIKALSKDKMAERLDKIAMFAWISYFTLCVMWPWPLHLYEPLVVFAFMAQGTALSPILFTGYYLFSVLAYVHRMDILQVSGRLILLVLAVVATVGSIRTLTPEEADIP